MSKAPPKQRHLEIEYKIYKEWKAVSGAADSFTRIGLDSILYAHKEKLEEKIREIAEEYNRLSSCDEKIFDYYSKLIGYYEDAVSINISFKHGFLKKKDNDVLMGLNLFLNARIAQFYESKNTFMPRETNINPVEMEKNGIIAKCLKAQNQNIDANFTKLTAWKYFECLLLTREHIFKQEPHEEDVKKAFDSLLNAFRGFMFQSIYKNYRDTAYFAVMFLNDMNKRKITHHYYKALAEEKGYLSDILNNQIDVLDSIYEKSGQDEFKEKLYKFILILKEAHQFVTKESDEIDFCFKEAAKYAAKPSIEESFEEFCENMSFITPEYILSKVDFEGLLIIFRERFERYKQTVEKEIADYIENEIGDKNTKKFVFYINRAAFSHEALAKDLAGVFEDITDKINLDWDTFEDASKTDLDILTGIKETVSIKKDCIMENLDIFAVDAEKLILSFDDEKYNLSDEDIRDCLDEVVDSMFDSLKQILSDERKVIMTIRKTLNDYFASENYKNAVEKVLKKKRQKMEQMDKMCRKFDKDVLLYEVSTFEEIIHYSVTKLLESENEAVLSIVKYINEKYSDIDRILKNYDILPIRPKPHEMFNGKEHEVLVAEFNEEYKKGEIIKLMNSGFKSGDAVLFRANVIAAK